MRSIIAIFVTLPGQRLIGPDMRRITSRRSRSISPTTYSRQRERDRLNSPNRRRRRDSISARGGDAYIRDIIFLRTIQQLISIEST
jgi:hypothetical protein